MTTTTTSTHSRNGVANLHDLDIPAGQLDTLENEARRRGIKPGQVASEWIASRAREITGARTPTGFLPSRQRARPGTFPPFLKFMEMAEQLKERDPDLFRALQAEAVEKDLPINRFPKALRAMGWQPETTPRP